MRTLRSSGSSSDLTQQEPQKVDGLTIYGAARERMCGMLLHQLQVARAAARRKELQLCELRERLDEAGRCYARADADAQVLRAHLAHMAHTAHSAHSGHSAGACCDAAMPLMPCQLRPASAAAGKDVPELTLELLRGLGLDARVAAAMLDVAARGSAWRAMVRQQAAELAFYASLAVPDTVLCLECAKLRQTFRRTLSEPDSASPSPSPSPSVSM